MGGWKTWLAAAIVSLAAVLSYFGYADVSKSLLGLGGALGLVGLGHKIEKSK